MPVVQQAVLVSIFLGGCITGAAVLSLSANPIEPAKAKAPATFPPQSPQKVNDSVSIVATNPERPSRDEHEATDEPEEPESAASAADVLAHLEAAYQERLSAAALIGPSAGANGHDQAGSLDEQSEAPDPEPAEALTQVTVAEPSPAVENVVEVQVEVARAENHHVALERTDVHGDVHHGSVHRGDVYEGDVHQGNVNQVQQVAVLNYQPIFVLPQGSVDSRPLPAGPSHSGKSPHYGRHWIDPWAPVAISPRHDPWGSAKWSPRHDPWRSSVFGKRP